MRILLVEDEVRLAQALARGLRAEGFDAALAHDGVTGQRLAEEGDFDVIVLDIMLPGRNGYVVCANLRAAGIRTPILMLTAKDGPLDEAEALDTGADDYLSKPFSFVVLVARIRALTRRAQVGGPIAAADGTLAVTPLRVGDLMLDPSSWRLTHGGAEIKLTAKEFTILRLLMEQPGAVVSKARLLEDAWDFADPPAPNVLEVHVSALRKKLGDCRGTRSESGSTTGARPNSSSGAGAAGSIIETVRGVGYRIRDVS